VRVQVGVPGMAGYGSGRGDARCGAAFRPVFEPAYIRRAFQLFEACRKELGEEIELLHDVHERVTPIQAVQFCKDARSSSCSSSRIRCRPRTSPGSGIIRQQCATPIAMGELFNSPHEWNPLIASG
jgi:mannonate dehydratase